MGPGGCGVIADSAAEMGSERRGVEFINSNCTVQNKQVLLIWKDSPGPGYHSIWTPGSSVRWCSCGRSCNPNNEGIKA